MHHLSPERWCEACLMRYITGSRMLMFGEAMSIFARSVRAPSGNSPFSIRSNRSRFSATVRSRYGLFLPGSVSVPRCSRISSAVRSQTYALPALISWIGPIVELLEVVRGVEQPIFPIAAEPADVVDDRIDVLLLFLGRIRVVEPQVELAAEFLARGRSSGRCSWHGRCADSRSARAETAYARARRSCRPPGRRR